MFERLPPPKTPDPLSWLLLLLMSRRGLYGLGLRGFAALRLLVLTENVHYWIVLCIDHHVAEGRRQLAKHRPAGVLVAAAAEGLDGLPPAGGFRLILKFN